MYWMRYACAQDKTATPISLPGSGKTASTQGLVLSAVCEPKAVDGGTTTPLQLDINRYQTVTDLDRAYQTLLGDRGSAHPHRTSVPRGTAGAAGTGST